MDGRKTSTVWEDQRGEREEGGVGMVFIFFPVPFIISGSPASESSSSFPFSFSFFSCLVNSLLERSIVSSCCRRVVSIQSIDQSQ